MTRVGITGHMDLTPDCVPLVRQALKDALAPHAANGDLTGVSCIAAGADSIFADVVLELGGQLEVVLPAADYRQRKVKPDHADLFDRLVSRAATVRIMPHEVSNRDAYATANDAVLSSIDILMAVWDGLAPADRAGTAAVIDQARTRGLNTHIIWPEGSQRIATEV